MKPAMESTIKPIVKSNLNPTMESAESNMNDMNDINTQKTKTKITTHPTLPSNRRRIYLALLTIPPGRWTTYSALASHLQTSPRAIGTAMRMNPFVPEVPCHRVVGSDRTLCGYIHGVDQKRRLLEGEGVMFDSQGRVIGEVFQATTTAATM